MFLYKNPCRFELIYAFIGICVSKYKRMNRGRGRGRGRGAPRCLVCRNRRRRCDNDCEYGQYFPDNRATEFDNACELFGWNKLMRLMQSVEVDQRQATAESILVEATILKNNPRGCLGYVMDLNSQISSSLRELEITNQLLAFYREQENTNTPSQAASSIPPQSNQLGCSSRMQGPNIGDMVRNHV